MMASMLLMSGNILGQWTTLPSGTTEKLNEIVFPSNDTGYVAGTNGAILRTFNGGDTWDKLEFLTSKHVEDIFFLNSRIGFVVGQDGLFAQTQDAGETWDIHTIRPQDPVQLSAVCFTSPLTGYAGGRTQDLNGVIFKTTDGGITWTVTDTPTSFLDIDFKRIVFPTPDTGYALTRGMCMKTVDAGDTWQITDPVLVESGSMFSLLEDAHFFSADTGFIVGWYNGFCGYTDNGGQMWTDQFIFHNQWFAVDFPTRSTGYLVGWGQLAKTTDGGKSWEDITPSGPEFSSIYSMTFTDEQTGYVCGDHGVILKTSEGGITSTPEIVASAAFRIFPNPNNGLLHIATSEDAHARSSSASVRIITMTGRVVYEYQQLSLPATLDVGTLSGGLYFIEVVTGNSRQTAKLVRH